MRAANSFRFYFSFRSPFAAIAIYRLRRAAQFSNFEIELIPVWPENIFGGHMDNPTDNIFKMAYFAFIMVTHIHQNRIIIFNKGIELFGS